MVKIPKFLSVPPGNCLPISGLKTTVWKALR